MTANSLTSPAGPVEAVHSLPDTLEPLWIEAVNAHVAGDTATAIRGYAAIAEACPAHLASHLRLIRLLRDAQKGAEAEVRTAAAMALFPGEADLANHWGWLAFERQDLQVAGDRFETFRARHPDRAEGVIGGAEVLRGSGFLADADALLGSNLERFPTSPDLAFVHAYNGLWMRTGGLLDWDAVLVRWARLRTAFPGFYPGYLEGIKALAEAGQPEAAEALVGEAIARFPGDARLVAEYARSAEARQDWAEMARRYHAAAETMPNEPLVFAGLGRALSLDGRHDDAEAVLAAAIERFPRHTAPSIEYAATANLRQDWPKAVARWQAALNRFPDDREISQKLAEARLRLAESAPTEPTPTAEARDMVTVAAMVAERLATGGLLTRDEMREVVQQFESLGGDSEAGGCEFGLFQREYGAEPMDLLRWSTMRHAELVAALDVDFDGVGLPENTQLILGHPTDNPEYFTKDARFGMLMHTFVRGSEVPYDRMYAAVCRRLQLLRRRLLADLTGSTKIFVYGNYPNDLNDEELGALFQAVRRHGNNTLLYVRSATDAQADGSVIEAEPGLLIGHIASLVNSGRNSSGFQPWPAWAKLIPAALALWKARRDIAASVALG